MVVWCQTENKFVLSLPERDRLEHLEFWGWDKNYFPLSSHLIEISGILKEERTLTSTTSQFSYIINIIQWLILGEQDGFLFIEMRHLQREKCFLFRMISPYQL